MQSDLCLKMINLEDIVKIADRFQNNSRSYVISTLRSIFRVNDRTTGNVNFDILRIRFPW